MEWLQDHARSFQLSYNYANSLQDLPPTYSAGNLLRGPQIIPDYASPSEIKSKMDAVDKADAARMAHAQYMKEKYGK